MSDSNKVKFGLKNVHYAKATVTGSTVTYAIPVPIPGAVNLSMDPQGEETNFYADDTKYYNVTNNTGYSGDLEVAKFPESFYTDIFGQSADTDGVLFVCFRKRYDNEQKFERKTVQVYKHKNYF